MLIIYIILALHFLFYIFFTMLFTAFVRISTGSVKLKIASYVLTIGFLCIDASVVGFNFNMNFLYNYLIFAYVSTIIFVLIMKALHKLDMTIWFPFAILCSPLIVFPATIFLLLIRKYFNKKLGTVQK